MGASTGCHHPAWGVAFYGQEKEATCVLIATGTGSVTNQHSDIEAVARCVVPWQCWVFNH